MSKFQKLSACNHCGSEEFFKVIKTKVDIEGNPINRTPSLEFRCANCNELALPVAVSDFHELNKVADVPKETTTKIDDIARVADTSGVERLTQNYTEETSDKRPEPMVLDINEPKEGETRARPIKLPRGF